MHARVGSALPNALVNAPERDCACSCLHLHSMRPACAWQPSAARRGTTQPVWICSRPQYERPSGWPSASTLLSGSALSRRRPRRHDGHGSCFTRLDSCYTTRLPASFACQRRQRCKKSLVRSEDGGLSCRSDCNSDTSSSVPRWEHHAAVYARNMTAASSDKAATRIFTF